MHHTQTLTASVTKPAPFYGYDTRLYYGNEAAPDLRFSRQPTHANELDEDEIEKTVKRGKKKLEKRARKAVGAGTQFTEMGNAEFDVLFGAVDRTNEVQFRLMFTPLAQQNMLELIKSDDGYGDDFAFYKTGCINCIRSEHAQHWQTDTDPAATRATTLRRRARRSSSTTRRTSNRCTSTWRPFFRCRCTARQSRANSFTATYTPPITRDLKRRCLPTGWAPRPLRTERRKRTAF